LSFELLLWVDVKSLTLSKKVKSSSSLETTPFLLPSIKVENKTKTIEPKLSQIRDRFEDSKKTKKF
jgi:hypothetical protein